MHARQCVANPDLRRSSLGYSRFLSDTAYGAKLYPVTSRALRHTICGALLCSGSASDWAGRLAEGLPEEVRAASKLNLDSHGVSFGHSNRFQAIGHRAEAPHAEIVIAIPPYWVFPETKLGWPPVALLAQLRFSLVMIVFHMRSMPLVVAERILRPLGRRWCPRLMNRNVDELAWAVACAQEVSQDCGRRFFVQNFSTKYWSVFLTLQSAEPSSLMYQEEII